MSKVQMMNLAARAVYYIFYAQIILALLAAIIMVVLRLNGWRFQIGFWLPEWGPGGPISG